MGRTLSAYRIGGWQHVGERRVLTRDCIHDSAGARHRTSTLPYSSSCPKQGHGHGQQAAAWGRTRNDYSMQPSIMFHAQLILPDGDPRATHLEAASPLQLDNAPHTHARYATHSISAIYVCGQLENKHQGLFPFKRLGILSNQISKGR